MNMNNKSQRRAAFLGLGWIICVLVSYYAANLDYYRIKLATFAHIVPFLP